MKMITKGTMKRTVTFEKIWVVMYFEVFLIAKQMIASRLCDFKKALGTERFHLLGGRLQHKNL